VDRHRIARRGIECERHAPRRDPVAHPLEVIPLPLDLAARGRMRHGGDLQQREPVRDE
jgi:hypothetical protein